MWFNELLKTAILHLNHDSEEFFRSMVNLADAQPRLTLPMVISRPQNA